MVKFSWFLVLYSNPVTHTCFRLRNMILEQIYF